MPQKHFPYIFTAWKRFLQQNGISYHHIDPFQIVTEPSPVLPALGFRFQAGDFSSYVTVQSIPVTSLNVIFKANTSRKLFEKLAKFKFLQQDRISANRNRFATHTTKSINYE